VAVGRELLETVVVVELAVIEPALELPAVIQAQSRLLHFCFQQITR
jgi:hypothetical protein